MTGVPLDLDSNGIDGSADTSSGSALRYEQFDTGESAAAMRFFSSAYTPGWRITSLGRGTAITHRRFEVASVRVDDVLIKGRVGCEIDSTDSVLVIQPRTGSLTVAGDPSAELDTAMIVADGIPCALQAVLARFHVVSVDIQLLSRIASAGSGPMPHLLNFADCRPRSDASARAFHRALEYVVGSFESTETVDQKAMVAAAANLLGAAVLDCFKSNVNEELLSNPSVPPALKAAISFIYRHAADGIGVNDVSDAVRLTPRAVQYMFRVHLDTTPTEYMRRVRLHRAHQELKASDRSATTISKVAQRWGFAHTGRFAALYRQTYGRSPHSTLGQQAG